jgi:hypothetical protein
VTQQSWFEVTPVRWGRAVPVWVAGFVVVAVGEHFFGHATWGDATLKATRFTLAIVLASVLFIRGLRWAMRRWPPDHANLPDAAQESPDG